MKPNKIIVCETINNVVTDQIDLNIPLTDYDIICDQIKVVNECDENCKDCIIQKLYSINQGG